MSKFFGLVILSIVMTSSCDSGKLTVLADLPSSLKEISAIEKLSTSDLFWVIEDAGNKNSLYGLNAKGSIVKEVIIDNVQNIDWEDLTSDTQGNLYIGDFGNNSRKRKNFAIYKVPNPEKASKSIDAKVISFTLPKDVKSQDFEAFFLYNDMFYIFSKNHKKCKLFRVPNRIGDHVAEYISETKLKGKHTKVTSADISDDGQNCSPTQP